MMTIKKDRISVIVLNLNGKHHLEECLDSLLGQTYPDFEVIFVDNGSADSSVEFVKNKYPQVKLISLETNKGFCEGNNIGYLHATGEFIALLNNDTRVDFDWLEQLRRAMDYNSKTGISASCMINYFHREILDTAGDEYDICGVGFKAGNRQKVVEYQKTRYPFGACAGAALYRRIMIEEIGFFDEHFFAVGEDIDLSFRARLAGYQCIYTPKARVYHKVNQTIGPGSDFLLYHSRRNIEYTYFKNMPGILLLLSLPFHFIYEILTFIDAIHKEKLPIFLRSKVDFLRHLPSLIQKRNHIQKKRVISIFELCRLFSKNYLSQRILKGFQDSRGQVKNF